MKIALAQNQWLDNQGNPLVAGRVTVYMHESDTPATVYTLEGDEFREAQNPFILDEGGRCPTGSIWFDATIVDVKVESYNGTPGSYSLLDRYEDGFIVPDVVNDTVVTGMAGLAAANPQLGVVTVVGYSNAHDCEARQFVWDPYCSVAEDGGAIVCSTSTENGRWILLSDNRYMPSSYYGIRPGESEANISAFLSYPEYVGSWSIRMPPVPRFKKGTYTSNGTISTLKTVAFDTGAKFTALKFMIHAAEVMYNPDYVADFQFTDQAVAESSWFRTAQGFWKCDAHELHQSRTNHFTDNSMGNYGSTVAVLMHKRISGTPLSLTGSGNLEFNHCDIANYALSTLWYTVHKNGDFTDKWFNDGSFDIGTDISHRQLVRMTENRIALDNFANPYIYVLLLAANGAQDLDLQNRVISTINASMPFTTIRNAGIANAYFSHGVNLENVWGCNLYLQNNYMTVNTDSCRLVLKGAGSGTWNDHNSTIMLATDIDTTYTTINWLGTSVDLAQHRIGRKTDDLVYQKTVLLWDCTVNNGTVACSHPVILDSNVANTMVYVYPCEVVLDNVNTWTMSMEFRGNRFNGNSAIAIGAHNGITDHLGEVYECSISSLAITDNVFNTASMGVTCPFWSGAGLAFRFLQGFTLYSGGSASLSNVELFPVDYTYKNNSGNCPREFSPAHPANLPAVFATVDGWQSGTLPTDLSFMSGQFVCSVFAFPALLNSDRSAIPAATVSAAGVYEVDKRSVVVPYRAKATTVTMAALTDNLCIDYPMHAYLPMCACDRSLPNDMFYCAVGALSTQAQMAGINPIKSGA